MSKAIQRFSLDVTHPDVQASVRIMQGDDNRQWRFTFANGGQPYILPARCTAMLVGTKPDDTVIENGLVVQGNEVIYDFGAADPENGIEQISTVPGSFEVQILLFDEYGAVLHAPRLWVTVFSSSYTERMANVSMDQFGGIKELIGKISEFEKILENLGGATVTTGTYTIPVREWSDTLPYAALIRISDLEKGQVVFIYPKDDATKAAAGAAQLSVQMSYTDENNDFAQIIRAETGAAPLIPLNLGYIIFNTGTEEKAVVTLVGVDAVGEGGSSGTNTATIDSGNLTVRKTSWDISSPYAYVSHLTLNGLDKGHVALLMPMDDQTQAAAKAAQLSIKLDNTSDTNDYALLVTSESAEKPMVDLNFKYILLNTGTQEDAVVTLIGVDAVGSGSPSGSSGIDESAVKNIINQVVPEWARASDPPDSPVDSVNGKTGAVKLGAEDVNADPAGTAATKVSEHDTYTGSHNDIRIMIQGLSDRLNALANSDDITLDDLKEIVAYIKANKSLIDSITASKVNVTDIINDLTTNVSNKPLSAAQGVALKSLIDGLSNNKLNASELTSAINTALAQAKESGEFKGDPYNLTEADKSAIVAAVIESLGGNPIFGYVDENNNIIVQGNLGDGTYSVKYEMEDGSTVDIGNLVLDSNVYYSVTKNLTNCTINNNATQVVEGSAYSATITANSGYELSSVSVTMGGSAVSVSGGVINIASVTGDIVITAVAEETAVAITNWIEEVGYTEDTRLSLSSGNTTSASGYKCTGFIPAKNNDVIRIKNIDITSENATNIIGYDSDKNPYRGGTSSGNYGTTLYNLFVTNGTNSDGVYIATLGSNITNAFSDELAYIRLGSKSITSDSILTINQEIV